VEVGKELYFLLSWTILSIGLYWKKENELSEWILCQAMDLKLVEEHLSENAIASCGWLDNFFTATNCHSPGWLISHHWLWRSQYSEGFITWNSSKSNFNKTWNGSLPYSFDLWDSCVLFWRILDRLLLMRSVCAMLLWNALAFISWEFQFFKWQQIYFSCYFQERRRNWAQHGRMRRVLCLLQLKGLGISKFDQEMDWCGVACNLSHRQQEFLDMGLMQGNHSKYCEGSHNSPWKAISRREWNLGSQATEKEIICRRIRQAWKQVEPGVGLVNGMHAWSGNRMYTPAVLSNYRLAMKQWKLIQQF